MRFSIYQRAALVLAVTGLISPAAHGRLSYFSSIASGNWTADPGFHTPGCGCLGAMCSCTFDFTCSIQITNVSTQTQTLQNWNINFSRLTDGDVPAGGNYYRFATPEDPFAGVTYTNTTLSLNGVGGFRFNSQSASSVVTAANAPITLAPFGAGNDSAILRLTSQWSQGFVITIRPNNPLDYLSPGWTVAPGDFRNYKLTHMCSGRLDVVDANAQNPGFVVAHGELDYIADSYQNPEFNSGTKFRGIAGGATNVSLTCTGCRGRTGNWDTEGGGAGYMKGFPSCGASWADPVEIPKEVIHGDRNWHVPYYPLMTGAGENAPCDWDSKPGDTPANGQMAGAPYGWAFNCEHTEEAVVAQPGTQTNRLQPLGNPPSTFDTHSNWQSHIQSVPIVVNGGRPF